MNTATTEIYHYLCLRCDWKRVDSGAKIVCGKYLQPKSECGLSDSYIFSSTDDYAGFITECSTKISPETARIIEKESHT